MIHEIAYEDLKEASRVLWKSFYDAEEHNHTLAGMERFRDLVEPVSLSMNTFDGSILLYGYFEDGRLLAVGALKEKKHILMLYVLPSEQKNGIGKKLLRFLETQCDTDCISLNSSDGAIGFYQKCGYVVCGERRIEEGLISTPMKKTLSL